MSLANATVRRIGSASTAKPELVPCSLPERLATPFQAPIIAEAKLNVSSWPLPPVNLAIASAATDSSTVITKTL